MADFRIAVIERPEMLRAAIEGAPVRLASDLSCIPVVAWRMTALDAAASTTTPSAHQNAAAASTLPQDIALEPLALILAGPNGVERLSLGDSGAKAAASTQVDPLTDRLPEHARQACVDAVFGAPAATADGFRLALRRAVARLSPDPGDRPGCRIEILSSEIVGEATIAGGASRSALGMSAEGVYH